MATTDEVLRHLNALDFPADRDEIVREAEREGAPEDVVKALRAMPPVTYANRDEIIRSARTEVAPELSPSERAERARDKTHPRIAEHMRDVPHREEP